MKQFFFLEIVAIETDFALSAECWDWPVFGFPAFQPPTQFNAKSGPAWWLDLTMCQQEWPSACSVCNAVSDSGAKPKIMTSSWVRIHLKGWYSGCYLLSSHLVEIVRSLVITPGLVITPNQGAVPLHWGILWLLKPQGCLEMVSTSYLLPLGHL